MAIQKKMWARLQYWFLILLMFCVVHSAYSQNKWASEDVAELKKRYRESLQNGSAGVDTTVFFNCLLTKLQVNWKTVKEAEQHPKSLIFASMRCMLEQMNIDPKQMVSNGTPRYNWSLTEQEAYLKECNVGIKQLSANYGGMFVEPANVCNCILSEMMHQAPSFSDLVKADQNIVNKITLYCYVKNFIQE